MAFVVTRLTLLSACAAVVGCSSNHDLLAQKPDQPVSDAGPSDRGDETFPVTPRNDAAPVDAGDTEPPGPWILTLVNGLADLDGVGFCFVPLADGAEAAPDTPPIPDAPGLAFGARVVLGALGPIDLATTDVHPYLVVGAAAASRASCRELLRSRGDDAAPEAGPPAVVSLPLIPARTLAESRSYLAVVTGCAGGGPAEPEGGVGSRDAGSGDADAIEGGGGLDPSSICGKGRGADFVGLSLVRLSRRLNAIKLGFQTMNASSAASPASLLIAQAITNNSIFFANAIDTGQITPHAQPGFVAKADFGLSLGDATLHVLPPAGSKAFAEFQSSFASLLAANQRSENDLTEGSNYTFVLLGAQPGVEAGSAWHPFRVALVENAPKVAKGDGSTPAR